MNKKLILIISIVFVLIITGITTYLILSNRSFEIRDEAQDTPSNNPQIVKVLVLNFDPILENYGGQKLSEYRGWNNSEDLNNQVIKFFQSVSDGYVNYTVSEWIYIDGYIDKPSGSLTDDIYISQCLSTSPSDLCNDTIDYKKFIEDYQICEKANNEQIDELWVWGAPWMGMWGSNLTGTDAFWYNSSPTLDTTCSKQVPIMGLNYERGLAEAVESFGHRTESAMDHTFSRWYNDYQYDSVRKYPGDINDWELFTMKEWDDGDFNSSCGLIHGAVNTQTFPGPGWWYIWDDTNYVNNNCDNFYNYPSLTGATKYINCTEWGCSDLGFKEWWFKHIPNKDGIYEGKWNNWWRYILNYKKAVEDLQNPCIPNCDSKTCGDDGCGGQCGICNTNQVCDPTTFTCINNCSGCIDIYGICKEGKKNDECGKNGENCISCLPNTCLSNGICSISNNDCAKADIWGKTGTPDNKVNIYDISKIISYWNWIGSPGGHMSDIWGESGTPDGKVNIYDISRTISCWTRSK